MADYGGRFDWFDGTGSRFMLMHRYDLMLLTPRVELELFDRGNGYPAMNDRLRANSFVVDPTAPHGMASSLKTICVLAAIDRRKSILT